MHVLVRKRNFVLKQMFLKLKLLILKYSRDDVASTTKPKG